MNHDCRINSGNYRRCYHNFYGTEQVSENDNTRAYRQGTQHELDRIIKLLNHLRCEKPHDCRKWHDHYAYSPDELIEILKGEVD